MAGSLILAYALLLTGGPLGWHRLYCGQAAEAVLYGQSFGYCGLGWLLDFLRLPRVLARAGAVAPDRSYTVFALSRQFAVAYVYAFLAGWLFLYDVADARDVLDERARLAVFTWQAVAAGAGAALCGAASGGRPRTVVAAALALVVLVGARAAAVEASSPAVAAAGACIGALLTAARRAAPPAVAAAEAAGESARRGKTDPRPAGPPQAGAKPRSSPPRKGRGCCRHTGRLCAVSLAQGLFWAVLTAGVVLHSDVAVNASGGWDKEGLRTVKLGSYAWEHRDELLRLGSTVAEELRRHVHARGWAGIAHDVKAELAKRRESDHAVLGVPRDADAATIRAAYRRLAKELHPDRLPAGLSDDERAARIARFRRVVAAHEALTKRAGGSAGGDSAEL